MVSALSLERTVTNSLKVWDLFEGKHLFKERLPSRNASTPAHLARMVALLEPPPKELLERAQFSGGGKIFDETVSRSGICVVCDIDMARQLRIGC